MYPVSGGTARFPHFAFGSVAGTSFGFFSWLQAVYVAPIECFAVMQYAPVLVHGPTSTSTTDDEGHHRAGLRLHDHPDGHLHGRQLPGHAPVQPGQQRRSRVEGGHPRPGHHRAVQQFQSEQLQPPAAGSCPTGCRASSARCPPRGIVFAYSRLRAGRPASGRDQEPAAEPAPGDHHRHRAGHRDLHPAPGRVHRRHPASAISGPKGWPGRRPPTPSSSGRSLAWPAWSGSPGWRTSCGSTRSSRRSAPA